MLKKACALKAGVRQIHTEALVDTGTTRLYLKPSVIRSLGLRKTGSVLSRTINGDKRRNLFAPVLLDIQGRKGIFEVVDIDESVPNLIGQIPLEHMDFVVDPKNQKLRGNPDHGDKLMTEEY